MLEIELHGAQQVRALHPDAVVIFVMPPSREEQQRRLRARGDPEDKVAKRLQKAEEEEPIGLALADHVVVNDEIDRAVKEMQSIIASHTTPRDVLTCRAASASAPRRSATSTPRSATRMRPATVDAAWAAGIRVFDTAPLYGHGLAERRLGAALGAHPRDDYLLSTKVGRVLVPGTPDGRRRLPCHASGGVADSTSPPMGCAGRSRRALTGWASTASTSR